MTVLFPFSKRLDRCLENFYNLTVLAHIFNIKELSNEGLYRAATMGFNRRVQNPSFIKWMFHFSINPLIFLYLQAIIDNTEDFQGLKEYLLR